MCVCVEGYSNPPLVPLSSSFRPLRRTWWNDEVSCSDRERGLSGPAIPSDSVIHSGYLRHPPYFLRHSAITPLGPPATTTSSFPFPHVLPPFFFLPRWHPIARTRHDTRRDETREATTSVSCAFATSGPSRFPEEIPRLDSLARPIQILSAFDARDPIRTLAFSPERASREGNVGNLRNSNIPPGEKGRREGKRGACCEGSWVGGTSHLFRAFRMNLCFEHLKQIVAQTVTILPTQGEVQQCVNSKDFKHGENAK